MKKLILLPFLTVVVLFIYSCGVPEAGSGAISLDGPILESVNRDGSLEFNGAVINTSPEPVKNVFVVIILKDVNGNIIEANSVNVHGDNEDFEIYPNQRSFFTVTFDSAYTNVHTKDVEIYYDYVLEHFNESGAF